MSTPRLVHLTTTDMSLALLLGPQLAAFARAGYEVVGVSAHGGFVDSLVEAGIRHVSLEHATRAMSPVDDARAMAEFYGLCRMLRPDIVHTHNPKPGLYGRVAARAAGAPVVVNTVHGLYATRDDSWRRRAAVYGLERLAAACSDAELVQNPEDLETLSHLGVPRRRLHLLGNGIDLARFQPSGREEARTEVRGEWGASEQTVVVGAVGRLVREKGYPELFEAARLLRRRRPETLFVVAGPEDPAKGDRLSRDELERAKAEGVVLLGLRADVERLYAGIDIYVLASHREGFPRSAMEAAAMGLPIVASNIRGCRQVVDHGSSGFLVPVGDPEALAGALERLAGDPRLRATMGQRARHKAVREFDQDKVIDTTLEVYDRLLARAKGGPARGGDRGPARGGDRGPAPPRAEVGISVRPGTEADAGFAALLHATSIVEGFLPTLGTGFLRRLYRTVARHPGSILLVAEQDGRPVGFLAGTEDVGVLYKEFSLRDGLVAGLMAAPRLVVSWRKVWETLRYPVAEADHPRAELLAMAVDPIARGRGVGRRLVEELLEELSRRGVRQARVMVASNNPRAIGLYEAAGFRPAAHLELHQGTPSLLLTWRAPHAAVRVLR
jgi:glycosyltransferase involved in cell wall biosynthesis/ribosomal protein S18 acetylase RimI-like enzyme